MGKTKLPVAALVGNPNVGKSTLFNCLTGMKQHTGNWPGKTVALAQGRVAVGERELMLVDLPGTYSLRSRSREEQVTEDFIRTGEPDCVVTVCDASCLERNLILVQQVLQLTSKAVVCVNLMDEAERANIRVDCGLLETLLGVPVIPTSAAEGAGSDTLVHTVLDVIAGKIPCAPVRFAPDVPSAAYAERAASITRLAVTRGKSDYRDKQLRLDRILTSRRFGLPLVLLLLTVSVWLTVVGANGPSRLLQAFFNWTQMHLLRCFGGGWISSLLIDGVYATTARVISVMLPPMAIFFPMFTLLEDIGYLPRVAFLLDHHLSRCGSCGKQALTMCMGLGCNAVGVTGCRIIDSPRERVLAMVTNSFLPCNGRFPTLILLASVFFGGAGLGGALAVSALVLLGTLMSMAATRVLSATCYRGKPGDYLMELPPFRKPRVGQILVRAFLDRTVFVAGRAVAVAAPAGAILWLCGHMVWNDIPLLSHLSAALEPIGALLGMDGALLLAFLFSIPANELVTPILVMALTGSAALGGEMSFADIGAVLLSNGWTWQKALCVMVFTVFHWPCSTTLITVYKESGKLRYAALAFILPTLTGILLCMLLNFAFQHCG